MFSNGVFRTPETLVRAAHSRIAEAKERKESRIAEEKNFDTKKKIYCMFVSAVCEVLFRYHRDFHLFMSRHTQMEISMLTKLNLAHGVAEHIALVFI